MKANAQPQHIPVKVYRSSDRLTIAAPMPGVEPEDIRVEVQEGRVILHAEPRGVLKDEKEVLIDEWNPGPYHRELELPAAVNGDLANVTYGNGVLVTVLPLAERTRPTLLTLETIGPGHGMRQGSHGHPVEPVSRQEHEAARARGGHGPS